MDDKTQKIVNKMKESTIKLGQMNSTLAIGHAVVALVKKGEAITVESIITHLQADTESHPSVLIVQAQNEAAEKELLEAQQKSQS